MEESVSRLMHPFFVTFALFAICGWVTVSNIDALEGEDIGKSAAQIGGGYAAHFAGNRLGNWLLDRSDDFPTSSLSSLSVVATSLVVSVGTSASVYGIGRAFDDEPYSFGWTLLGGISAVGGSTLIGALIGLDDWKSGAAVGSVLGRYIVPVSATVFYSLGDSNREVVLVPVMTVRF